MGSTRQIIFIVMLAILAALFAFTGEPSAQVPDTALTGNLPPEGGEAKPIHTEREYLLSLLVLGFGCLALIVQIVFLWAKSGSVRPEQLLPISAVTLVVVGGLFLMTAGFTLNQIAPVIGLYGSIIGYILGTREIHRYHNHPLPEGRAENPQMEGRSE